METQLLTALFVIAVTTIYLGKNINPVLDFLIQLFLQQTTAAALPPQNVTSN